MLYFVVMGSLLLSVLFSTGWLLHRTGRWVLGGRSARRGAGRPAAKPRKRATTRAKPASGRGLPAKSPKAPGRVARFLARLGAVWPLTLLALLLYGGFKLAERGMGASPRTPPSGFYDLVSVLGWLALALVCLSAVVMAARWRCRDSDPR